MENDAAGRIRAFVARVAQPEKVGLALFVVAAIAAFRAGVTSRFLPGWDFHYHVMSAAMTARVWLGDPFYAALYHKVNPLDSNTLFYTLLFPLEAVGTPLFAARAGVALLYFVGYPVACAIALRLAGRPIWGALLAFPAVHVWSFSYGGFLPFAIAAPFFVLSFAFMDRVLEKPTRGFMIACAATCTLTFLAHSHVFAWMAALLAVITVLRIGRELVPGLARDPRGAALEAARIAGRALAVIAPAVFVAALWYHRAAVSHAPQYTPRVSTWAEKFTHLQTLLVFTRSDDDFLYVLALPLVVAACWLLSGRRRGGVGYEIVFVLSASAYLWLPLSVSGQAIAARHLDMAMWLLPLVVVPARPDGWARRAAVVALVGGYAYLRSAFFARELAALQAEYSGLLAIANDCPAVPPDKRPLLGYATMGGMDSKVWHTPSPHQAHATLAAMCGMETPLYDTREYPHNAIPLRYRGAPPAPIEILVDDQRWFGRLVHDYDYVLVHAWHPPPSLEHEAEASFERVRASGEWTLWKRR